MGLSHSELLALVDEVNVAVSQIIANYAELREGMIDAGATDAAAAKVDRLRCHRPGENQPRRAGSKPATLRVVWSWKI